MTAQTAQTAQTAHSPETDLTASARPAPVPLDRTIKLLLSLIAVALTLIALRPFIAPMPAHAQIPGSAEAAAAVGSGIFITISDKKDGEPPTALVGYKGSQGQPLVAALAYRAGQWQHSNNIRLSN